MADNVTLTTSTVGNAIRSMHKQINDAIKSLSKLDSENQVRLANLRNGIEKYSENGTNDNQGQNLSIGKEVNSRENLSVDINNQYTELVHLNTELLSYQQNWKQFKMNYLLYLRKCHRYMGKWKKCVILGSKIRKLMQH